MTSNAPIARKKVTISIVRIPVSPITGRSMPARRGATTPGPASTRLIMPFTLPSCSLATIVPTAAE